MSTQENQQRIKAELEQATTTAEQLLHDPVQIQQFLHDVQDKMKAMEINPGYLADIWDTLQTLSRMVQAYTTGTYTDIPWGSIVMIVTATVYFLSPIDLIPDFIPVAGFLDDASVIAFVARQVQTDIERFTAWEKMERPSEG